jgi:hypothetical protein
MNFVDQAAGWNAIVEALQRLYGDRTSLRYDAVIPHRLGGPDPLDVIAVYKTLEPATHWHFITFGFSELYDKESKDPSCSGWGFELTFRVSASPDEEQPPAWALNLLQSLARYVLETHSSFAEGQHANFHRPIAPGDTTEIDALLFVEDPQLGRIETPNGAVQFLQVVGITSDEEASADERGERLLKLLREGNPTLITDLRRRSLVHLPQPSIPPPEPPDAEALVRAAQSRVARAPGATRAESASPPKSKSKPAAKAHAKPAAAKAVAPARRGKAGAAAPAKTKTTKPRAKAKPARKSPARSR